MTREGRAPAESSDLGKLDSTSSHPRDTVLGTHDPLQGMNIPLCVARWVMFSLVDCELSLSSSPAMLHDGPQIINKQKRVSLQPLSGGPAAQHSPQGRAYVRTRGPGQHPATLALDLHR